MRISAATAAGWARLLAWDASFLPAVENVRGAGGEIDLELEATGVALTRLERWPQGDRLAVAVQLVAAAAFLHERGWFPARALLRGARAARGEAGVALRLAELPCRRLDDETLAARVAGTSAGAHALLGRLLAPVLSALVPERRAAVNAAVDDHEGWDPGAALLAALLANPGAARATRHAGGPGRALWSRRFDLPADGVHFVAEEDLVRRLVAAATLRALAHGKTLTAEGGAFEEEDVARLQSRAASAGNDCLVFTTLRLSDADPLPLAPGEDSVWVISPRPDRAYAHAYAALEAGRQRPELAREVMSFAAASGFARPAAPGRVDERAKLLSSGARRLLGWLRNAPMGLSEDEIAAVAGSDRASLAELDLAGVAQRRQGVWFAVGQTVTADKARLGTMAEKLAGDSVRGLLAATLAGRDGDALASWCDARLDAGKAVEVLPVASAVVDSPPLAERAAEAALQLGRIKDAQRALQGVSPAQRGPAWHALEAWRLEQAGLPADTAEHLDALGQMTLVPRLAARVAVVEAERARRAGDRDAAARHFARAASLAGDAAPEAAVLLASLDGRDALHAVRRRAGGSWGADTRALAMHLLGLDAFWRGELASAATALRAALRTASGQNLRLLGDIHGDLGMVMIVAENGVAADRHLLVAERYLDRCGSLRAVTVVRANRAVLACDRLEWRRSRELLLASRELRREVRDVEFWFGELELARAELARGRAAEVEASFESLAEGVRAHGEHAILRQALAALRAHLALALGDLARAETAVRDAEEGERELVNAVVAAGRGEDPPRGLPHRWGVALSAQMLAAWRRGDRTVVGEIFERTFARTPLEAAVGLARLLAVLARAGESRDPSWAGLERRAEEALRAAELDGWAARLRGGAEPDPVRVLQAVDAIVNAGTSGLADDRIAALAHALGADWLEVRRHGRVIATRGTPSTPCGEVTVGGIEMRCPSPPGPTGRAALELIARHLGASDGPTEPARLPGAQELLGTSAELGGVRDAIARWAPLPMTVLVCGEPGTGKELVARALHRASGRSGSFVPVNCAGIPATLLEAELFGVTRGAFTGADRDRPGLVEAAEGGTLFLDEIGELPFELQAKLLRLVQEREVRRVGASGARTVDVRFVAATNRDLRAASEAGMFRRDLYFRLAVAVIEIPPLRCRRDDIDELAVQLTSRYAAAFHRTGVRLAPASLALLRGAEWPGNVRELESVIARAVAAAHPGEALGPDRFPGIAGSPVADSRARSWAEASTEFRRAYFENVLRECDGNRTTAARRAAISRQTLLYHLRELGLGGPRKS